MLFMSFWGVGPPPGECHGNLETVFVVKHGRPTVWETLRQFAHELPAHQTCDATATLRLSHQPAEDLHCCDVIRTKLIR
ncbi:hypothetical protein Q664_38100 [Archangium violaceum Cb vi76]|uniref:Uncharacterized protein n=1 Tax=Archangium violaceum Cb vi76 TaxID=1406225 RepID=A0A084SKD8_9BACT|nr:hypothetical protein Q664_38100 [Archangium violaceum Cb vi76]